MWGADVEKEKVRTMREPIVAIDLGTTKINVIIAEVDSNGNLQVVGVGNTPAKGMRRGMLVNMGWASGSIRNAVDQAEQMAGITVRSAYVGIAGDHIRSINNRAIIAVSRGDDDERSSTITQNDIKRVLNRAKRLEIPTEREILHVVPQFYVVDDEVGIKEEPVGLNGFKLEANVHIITNAVSSAQNIVNCVNRAGIEVCNLVLEPYASSYAVLNSSEKELGVALIDLGGGTSDIAVFYEGSLRHTSSIGLGGTNVTHDIASILNISMETAEMLKIKHGGLYPPIPDTPTIMVPTAGESREIEVDLAQLNEIIRARMEELMEFVQWDLKRSGFYDSLASGLVITGGGSLLRDTELLAEEVFGKDARIGEPRGLDGLVTTVHNPAFATGVGLVLYGFQHEEVEREESTGRTDSVGAVWGWVRKWFNIILN